MMLLEEGKGKIFSISWEETKSKYSLKRALIINPIRLLLLEEDSLRLFQLNQELIRFRRVVKLLLRVMLLGRLITMSR